MTTPKLTAPATSPASNGSALTPLQIENWKNLYPWMRGLSNFEIERLRDMLQKKVGVDSQAPNSITHNDLAQSAIVHNQTK